MSRREAELDCVKLLNTCLPEAAAKLKNLKRDGEPGLLPLFQLLELATKAAGLLMLRHKET